MTLSRLAILTLHFTTSLELHLKFTFRSLYLRQQHNIDAGSSSPSQLRHFELHNSAISAIYAAPSAIQPRHLDFSLALLMVSLGEHTLRGRRNERVQWK